MPRFTRRSFFKYLAAIVAVAGSLAAFAQRLWRRESSRDTPQERRSPMGQTAIIKTFPLGFTWQTRDPFLFCVHHNDHYPAGDRSLGPPKESLEGRQIGNDFELKDGFRMYHGRRVPGFPVHPHRGFETITVVLKGMVDHADSLGAAGRYGGGDTQWMTAGGGIQHAEMFPLLNQDRDNELELFQIWLNLPKAAKFARPHYTMLWQDQIPVLARGDQQGRQTEITVIAGQHDDRTPPSPPPNSWAADPTNETRIWLARASSNGSWTIPKSSAGINRTLFVFDGPGIEIGGRTVGTYQGVDLRSELDITVNNGNGESRMLLLQSRPIGEPVAQHGPFVMNTHEEIEQAYADYRKTEFGSWPWPDPDPIHPMEKGRFAKHADGREEVKS